MVMTVSNDNAEEEEKMSNSQGVKILGTLVYVEQ
jgi:hypothetical protein